MCLDCVGKSVEKVNMMRLERTVLEQLALFITSVLA